MPNAIPLLEGTAASGGYLVRDTYGQTLQNTVERNAAALSLARVDRVPGKRQRYAVYAGRPTAAFVDEAAPKPVTGAEFAEVLVDVKKMATNVIYTQELLEDAVEDPTVLVNADVETAFAQLFDAHILGYENGSQITTQFNTALRATTQTVEYVQANQDALPRAISAAMALIERNGGRPNGAIFHPDANAVIRDARTAVDSTQPLFQPFTSGGAVEQFYGQVALRFSTNLPTLTGTAAAGRVVGIVGDFSHSVAVLRKDITVRTSEQATLDVSGTLHHLWQQNKTAFQWEMRGGHFAHDLNRMFVAIINAA